MAKTYGSVAQQVSVYSGIIRPGTDSDKWVFDASVFNANATIKAMSKTISYLEIQYDSGEGPWLFAHFTDSTQQTLVQAMYNPPYIADFGLSYTVIPADGSYYIDLTLGTETQNLTKEIKKFYGSVAQQVTVYSGEPRTQGDATFDASVFNANPDVKAIQGTISYLQGKHDADRTYLSAYLTDSSEVVFFNDYEGTYGDFADYGITPLTYRVFYIDLTTTTETQNLTKEIKKLYGSVNGQTKLIYASA